MKYHTEALTDLIVSASKISNSNSGSNILLLLIVPLETLKKLQYYRISLESTSKFIWS
jgi:hypothetical protein